jgi:hypothetical protein
MLRDGVMATTTGLLARSPHTEILPSLHIVAALQVTSNIMVACHRHQHSPQNSPCGTCKRSARNLPCTRVVQGIARTVPAVIIDIRYPR